MNSSPKFILQRFSDFVPLVILTAMLTLGMFVSPADLPQGDFCIFKKIMGFDCPGCGLTRSFLLIPRGAWREVMRLNAAAPLVYIFFLGGFLSQIRLAFKSKGLKIPELSHRIVFGFTIITAIALLLQWCSKAYVYFSDHSIRDAVFKAFKFMLTFSGILFF